MTEFPEMEAKSTGPLPVARTYDQVRNLNRGILVRVLPNHNIGSMGHTVRRRLGDMGYELEGYQIAGASSNNCREIMHFYFHRNGGSQ